MTNDSDNNANDESVIHTDEPPVLKPTGKFGKLKNSGNND